MAFLKTAITLPESLLREVDRAANVRGESRSSFIRRVLRAALRARRDAAITRRLDELFSEEHLAEEQRRTSRELEEAGVPWDDEAW
jgi:Arc/MetJ-type ribon-helix-helix transcriptional regulator